MNDDDVCALALKFIDQIPDNDDTAWGPASALAYAYAVWSASCGVDRDIAVGLITETVDRVFQKEEDGPMCDNAQMSLF